ncbi:MAG: hypothetical protein JNL90_20260 [Planctomycetes bacterium]|nr:hypothetical protein [Planctomycetota bacterium]
MYLEVTPFVDGQPIHVELRNVPAGAKSPLLIWSFGTDLIDLTPAGVPGQLGPDLLMGGLEPMDSIRFTYDDVLPTGLVGSPLYLQAYVKLPGGVGRLSSMTATYVIGTNDDPGTDPTIVFPLPLTVTELLAPGTHGFARTNEALRVGVPLPKGQVFESNGIPQLTLLGGATEAQFATLAKWPDGSVKWALCEWRTSLAADGSSTAFSIDKGTGNFGGANLASVAGSIVTVDTGAARVVFDPAKDDLFDSYQLSGREVFSTTLGNRPRFWDASDVEWTWNETAVALRRNGPVRAEVEVDGTFTRTTALDDPDRIHVRFYVELCKGSTAAKVTASLRNTALSFPEHLLFRGFTFRGWLNETGVLDIRLPQTSTDGLPQALWSGKLNVATDTALFNQGFARLKNDELCYDPNWSNFVPLIERFATDSFAIEGVQARIGATYFTGDSTTGFRSIEREFADPTFMEVNASSGRGLLVGLPFARYFWPIELAAAGDGRIEVGLLPHKDPADAYPYTLTYASAETRFFWVMPEAAPAVDPVASAFPFDAPLAARADSWVYNQSDVWHWKLVTKTDVDNYCAHTGLRKPAASTTDVVRTIYEYSNTTGGGSNNWEETRRFFQWIRGGLGGAALNSWMEAYYKVDKMPWSIDDGTLSQRGSIRNKTAVVTKKDDYYNNSKHTYWQVVPDWGFAHGETYLLDSGRHMTETLLDSGISPNVKPNGNFVSGTYGALINAAAAVLDYRKDQALEDWMHDICFQWANVVFQVDNNFGVDTSQLGWQAPIGTPPGQAANPDGYMVTWAAGKSTDKAAYGYTTQGWTDIRNGSQAFQRVAHYLRREDPTDPLIGDLLARGEDWYHYAHRSIRDDWQQLTGDLYIIDVFRGDAGTPVVDPFELPGFDIETDDQIGYALQSIVNLKLEHQLSDTAFSYGVEMHRSMSKGTYDGYINDPILNEFIWRYLVHYGLLKP